MDPPKITQYSYLQCPSTCSMQPASHKTVLHGATTPDVATFISLLQRHRIGTGSVCRQFSPAQDQLQGLPAGQACLWLRALTCRCR